MVAAELGSKTLERLLELARRVRRVRRGRSPDLPQKLAESFGDSAPHTQRVVSVELLFEHTDYMQLSAGYRG